MIYRTIAKVIWITRVDRTRRAGDVGRIVLRRALAAHGTATEAKHVDHTEISHSTQKTPGRYTNMSSIRLVSRFGAAQPE